MEFPESSKPGSADGASLVSDDLGPCAVLHIPHASTVIPTDLRNTFQVSNAILDRELLKLTDHYTDDLYALEPALAKAVVFSVSRFVVDPERFADDEQEAMASRGMGVIYTSTTDGPDGAALRAHPTPSEREELLDRYYWPHHAALETAVSEILERRGRCLVIDCHSFTERPSPCDMNQVTPRPDICIGTDDYHTPGGLGDDVKEAFRAHDEGHRLDPSHELKVTVNWPYAGALVPLGYYGKDKRVEAVMIEVNRKLYVNEATGEKNEGFARTREMMRVVLEDLIRDRLSSDD